MKKISLWLVLALLCLTASAQAAGTSANLKVGVVNFQKALNEVKQGKDAKNALKTDFETKQKKLDLQQNELMKKKEEFEKQRLALSDEALRSKEKDLTDRFQKIQGNLNEFRQDLADKEGKMMSVILGNLKDIVSEIGKNEKFDLIVEFSQSSVIYAASQEDLTERVIKLYDKRHQEALKLN